MKTKMKAILSLSLAMALVSGAFAQNQGNDMAPQNGAQDRGHGHMHGMPSTEEHMKHMTEALNLTADQQTQIKGLMEAAKQQMDALRQNTSLTEQQRHEQMMAIHQSAKSSIRGILTSDQQTKFDQMHSGMKDHHHGHHADGHNGSGDKSQDPPPPPPAS